MDNNFVNNLAKAITISQVDVEARKNLGFKAGDTVRVQQKIKEKDNNFFVNF